MSQRFLKYETENPVGVNEEGVIDLSKVTPSASSEPKYFWISANSYVLKSLDDGTPKATDEYLATIEEFDAAFLAGNAMIYDLNAASYGKEYVKCIHYALNTSNGGKLIIFNKEGSLVNKDIKFKS